MSDIDIDSDDLGLDSDLDTDGDLDIGADDVVDSPVVDGTGLDLSQPPDPVDTSDVAPVQFGQTVEFPDGTHVENPHTDALGYVYQNSSDYIGGVNEHVVE